MGKVKENPNRHLSVILANHILCEGRVCCPPRKQQSLLLLHLCGRKHPMPQGAICLFYTHHPGLLPGTASRLLLPNLILFVITYSFNNLISSVRQHTKPWGCHTIRIWLLMTEDSNNSD